MTPASLPTTGPTSQPHHGVGARFVRRLGGAVRSIVSGGITLTRGLRRPAAPIASRVSPGAPGVETPVPPSRRRNPHCAPAAEPIPQSIVAAWLSGGHRRRGSAHRPDAPYLPEVYAGLSPEARTFLTTPMEECDPAKLALLYSTFEQHIAEAITSGAGFKDPKALFARVCGCFDAAIDHAQPGATAAVPPLAAADAAPVPSTDAAAEPPTGAAPAAPTGETLTAPAGAASEASPQAAPAAPTQPMPIDAAPAVLADAVSNALLVPVAPLPEAVLAALVAALPDAPLVPARTLLLSAPAAALPAGITVCENPTSEAAPYGTVPPQPGLRRAKLLYRSKSLRHGRRSRIRCWRRDGNGRPVLRRGRLYNAPRNPPLRRLCYAACAGPRTALMPGGRL